MKRAFSVALMIAFAAICFSQSEKSTAWPDLRRFSSDELKACYNDKTICGTNNIYAISDELKRRLPDLSTERLIACFADWKVCGVGDDLESGFAVSAEVARRGNPDALLDRYWTEPNPDVRYSIVQVAYHSKSKRAIAFMQKVLAAKNGDEDALYWPASYLAKRCDPDGLKWLGTRIGRPEGCIIFAPTVRYFGKCRYRPAIPYLIENFLDDACLNIVDAAANDLSKLYPDSPKSFDSLKEVQKYYCGRAQQEGFKVDCRAE